MQTQNLDTHIDTELTNTRTQALTQTKITWDDDRHRTDVDTQDTRKLTQYDRHGHRDFADGSDVPQYAMSLHSYILQTQLHRTQEALDHTFTCMCM